MPPRSSAPFVPRATLVLAGGVALFFVVSLLYSLPILMQAAPEGAPPDWMQEQVRVHLRGKTLIILAGSLLSVALVVGKPWKK